VSVKGTGRKGNKEGHLFMQLKLRAVPSAIFLFALILTLSHPVELSAQEEKGNIVRACTNLVMDYAYYRDHGDAEAYAALFTENGTLLLTNQPIQGHQAIAKAMLARVEEGTTRHVMTNVRITVVDDGHATGISYVSVYLTRGTLENGKPLPLTGPSLIGEYHDKFEKTGDGWRIAERRLQRVLAAPPPGAGGAPDKASKP
jgi:ketosteroid isomerase-like protein